MVAANPTGAPRVRVSASAMTAWANARAPGTVAVASTRTVSDLRGPVRATGHHHERVPPAGSTPRARSQPGALASTVTPASAEPPRLRTVTRTSNGFPAGADARPVHTVAVSGLAAGPA